MQNIAQNVQKLMRAYIVGVVWIIQRGMEGLECKRAGIFRYRPGNLAERVGFEPTLQHNCKPDFESGAFDLSATFPVESAIISDSTLKRQA